MDIKYLLAIVPDTCHEYNKQQWLLKFYWPTTSYKSQHASRSSLYFFLEIKGRKDSFIRSRLLAECCNLVGRRPDGDSLRANEFFSDP